jgi:hypothetical protein
LRGPLQPVRAWLQRRQIRRSVTATWLQAAALPDCRREHQFQPLTLAPRARSLCLRQAQRPAPMSERALHRPPECRVQLPQTFPPQCQSRSARPWLRPLPMS